MALVTLADRLDSLTRRVIAAERRAERAEEYAESTCRIYHSLYRQHADRLAVIEGRLGDR